MAENKKSFIAYSDWYEMFKALPDEVAGKLIKHIFSYVNDENPNTDDYIINALFAQVKNVLKRDLEKWEEQRQQRIDAGKRSAEVRSTKSNERSTSVNETERNPTVSVSVSVNDNVNKNNNYKKNLLSELSDSDVPNPEYLKIAKSFQTLIKQNIKEKGLAIDKIDKAKGIWYDDIRLLIETDNQSVDNIRVVYNFLKVDDFWKKNILSTSKLRAKFSELVMAAKTPKKTFKQEEPTRKLEYLDR